MEIKSIKSIKEKANGDVKIPVSDLRCVHMEVKSNVGLHAYNNIGFNVMSKDKDGKDVAKTYIINHRGTTVATDPLFQPFYSEAPTPAPFAENGLDVARDFLGHEYKRNREGERWVETKLKPIANAIRPLTSSERMITGNVVSDDKYDALVKIIDNDEHGATMSLDNLAILAHVNGIITGDIDREIEKKHTREFQKNERNIKSVRENLSELL